MIRWSDSRPGRRLWGRPGRKWRGDADGSVDRSHPCDHESEISVMQQVARTTGFPRAVAGPAPETVWYRPPRWNGRQLEAVPCPL